MFENKKILITGGTGSFGNTFAKKLLSFSVKEIRIFAGMKRNRMICEKNTIVIY